jgi:hypothetical protein
MSNGMENGLRLVVRHPVPSLNRLFAMNPWQRRREKLATQSAFASALSASGFDPAIRTTFVQNISLIASATRDSSRTTRRTALRSKSGKSAAAVPNNAPKS